MQMLPTIRRAGCSLGIASPYTSARVSPLSFATVDVHVLRKDVKLSPLPLFLHLCLKRS
jgi:hypothetical protein